MGLFLIPLVIDSPNQQGQDELNLPKVIEFVSTKLPQQTQLILGSEIEADHSFDNKIVLERAYQLPEASSFSEAEAEIEPLLRKMYSLTTKRTAL